MLRFDPFRDLDRVAPPPPRPSSLMAFDAVRDDDRVYVYFDVPGVDPDDIEVHVERNELTVTVERSWDPEGQTILASERPQGTFTRRLLLNDNLDTDALEASLDHGVLTVAIPVSERSKQRRIEVRRGGGPETVEPS